MLLQLVVERRLEVVLDVLGHHVEVVLDQQGVLSAGLAPVNRTGSGRLAPAERPDVDAVDDRQVGVQLAGLAEQSQ